MRRGRGFPLKNTRAPKSSSSRPRFVRATPVAPLSGQRPPRNEASSDIDERESSSSPEKIEYVENDNDGGNTQRNSHGQWGSSAQRKPRFVAVPPRPENATSVDTTHAAQLLVRQRQENDDEFSDAVEEDEDSPGSALQGGHDFVDVQFLESQRSRSEQIVHRQSRDLLSTRISEQLKRKADELTDSIVEGQSSDLESDERSSQFDRPEDENLRTNTQSSYDKVDRHIGSYNDEEEFSSIPDPDKSTAQAMYWCQPPPPGTKSRFVTTIKAESETGGNTQRSKSAISAVSLSELIQGRKGLSALTDDHFDAQFNSPSGGRFGMAKPASAMVTGTGVATSEGAISGLVSSWVLKIHSDAQLNAIASATAAAPVSAPTVKRRTPIWNMHYEMWKVVVENRGYLHGSRNYAGFTLARLQLQISAGHEDGVVRHEPGVGTTAWVLLFESTNSSNAMFSSDGPASSSTTTAAPSTSSLVTTMMDDKSLAKGTLLRLHKPVWKLALSREEMRELQSAAGYEGMEGETGVRICINWVVVG
ncbi:uncharacterized protein V1518DRAFT_416722 [Limtongia smithiae]|uniref:uncharacterized protein n=1 Tax=Limtongia smithiae TaxID=1125753 RepID=UPI0034CF3931